MLILEESDAYLENDGFILVDKSNSDSTIVLTKHDIIKLYTYLIGVKK